jgi:hypothetical protein
MADSSQRVDRVGRRRVDLQPQRSSCPVGESELRRADETLRILGEGLAGYGLPGSEYQNVVRVTVTYRAGRRASDPSSSMGAPPIPIWMHATACRASSIDPNSVLLRARTTWSCRRLSSQRQASGSSSNKQKITMHPFG